MVSLEAAARGSCLLLARVRGKPHSFPESLLMKLSHLAGQLEAGDSHRCHRHWVGHVVRIHVPTDAPERGALKKKAVRAFVSLQDLCQNLGMDVQRAGDAAAEIVVRGVSPTDDSRNRGERTAAFPCQLCFIQHRPMHQNEEQIFRPATTHVFHLLSWC